VKASFHPKPVVEPLGRHHDRWAFDCGVETLGRYIRKQAGQDMKKEDCRHVRLYR
jgi:hypothetical protein